MAKAPISLQNVIKELKHYHPKANLAKVIRAFNLAQKAHVRQRRDSGDPYIIHPLSVAKTLTEWHLGTNTITAALLHDTVEESNVTLSQIKKSFGGEVANLVNGVTKISGLKYTPEIRRVENLRKMILAMARDIRVVLIKLADRLNNMQTLAAKKDPADRQRIARETLEVYAPIANRLGIGECKGTLEDLAFPYLYPKDFKWLTSQARTLQTRKERYIHKVRSELLRLLKKGGLKVIEAHGRKKHLYSLWLKLKKRDMDFDQIYDLVALRVVVPRIRDCYATLGLIHKKWKPLPGRIKDYIATPKPNGYQSLHTTVIALEGEIVEIQVRTLKMHEEAEFGVAASWSYHEQKGLLQKLLVKIPFARNKKLERQWVKQLSSWQKETQSPREFLSRLRIDFFENRIFVFTPKGDIFDLPQGATPVDFAYQVHTDLGRRCRGAKISGRIAKLDTPLQNGQVVEILTYKGNVAPKRDWLRFVKTSLAQNKIRGWFRKANRDENYEAGKKLLNEQLREVRHITLDHLPPSRINQALRTLKLTSLTDVFTKIGEGELSTEKVIERLYTRQELLPQIDRAHQIAFKPKPVLKDYDSDGLVIKTAHCCQPQIGDKIVGFISKQRRIMVHKPDCPNAHRFPTNRQVEVSWLGKNAQELYPVTLKVRAADRLGLTSDIAKTLAAVGVNVIGTETLAGPENTTVIKLNIEVKNLRQLHRALSKIREIRDVTRVNRELVTT